MWYSLFKKYLVFSVILFVVFSGISTANINTITKETTQETDENIENDGESEFPATGFFYVKEIDDVWWYINSTGEKFFAVGCTGVGPSLFYYGNVSIWAKETEENLKKWGFNAVKGDRKLFPNWPTTRRFGFKQIDNIFGVRWMNSRFPDVFDPVWQEAVRDIIYEGVEEFRDDPNLIGYELGNELKWGPDYENESTFLEMYMAANKTTHGKNRTVQFLRKRYDNNTDEFNRVWNMNITDFNDLFNYTEFGIKDAWRIRSNISFFKRQLTREYPYLKDDNLFDKAKEDIISFCRLVAHTYFNVTDTSLEAADPNHLNLGVRFHLLGVPREVLEECANFTDVISINYYRNNILVYDPHVRFLSKKYGCVPLDDWMRKYYEISGKPLRVCEYNVEGNDGSWPIVEPRMLRPTLSRTQERRADIFEWYVTNCQKTPYLVEQGFWFLYRDSFDRNHGLVNLWDEPYTPLIERLPKVNSRAFEIHENASYSKTGINKLSDISFLPYSGLLYSNLYKKILNSSPIERCDPFSDGYNTLNPKVGITGQSYQSRVINNMGNGETIYVDNDSICPGNGSRDWPYCKIQYAIDNASHGDTIRVFNGTYSENIIINKSITLIGENKETTVIDGGRRGYAAEVFADYVTLTGFNITSLTGFSYLKNKDYRACAGIYLYKYNNSDISDNIFYKLNSWGIISLKNNNIKITNNTFYGTDSNIDCGVVMDSSDNALIADNTFTYYGLCGIWISSSKNNTIKNNIIESGKVFGILIWRAQDNIIIGNTLRKIKQKGICLKNSNNNIITQNNFIRNKHIPKDNLLYLILDIYYKIKYQSAAFFYSIDNNWNGNYWGRPRVLPKPIFGIRGTDGLIPCVNFDWYPLKKPYEV